jgi:hypothetical protein
MPSLDEVPETPRGWKIEVERFRLQGRTIYDGAPASASKIGDEQYLLLRVIWATHGRGFAQLRDDLDP